MEIFIDEDYTADTDDVLILELRQRLVRTHAHMSRILPVAGLWIAVVKGKAGDRRAACLPT